MTASELVAARQRLGLTRDQLAAELGIPPHAYRACEEGRATLPRRERQMLARLVASRAREPFVRERFPDMPEPPLPTGMRLVARAGDWLGERPAWMRPSLVGAALVAALVALRVVLALPTVARTPGALGAALATVPLAALAGAAGGLVYTLLGRPLLRVPVAGPYLAGTATVAGCLLAVAAMTWVSGEPLLDGVPSGRDATAFAIISVVLGVVLGWTLLRRLPRDRDGR
jgi:DNA-binding XRE family transcriptional regulator